MYTDGKLLIGKNEETEVCLLPQMANRHGLITGASGTGKTITAKVLAESFSDAGVPVFLADVKGDIEGTALPGEMNENIAKRVESLKLTDFDVKAFPVRFWDIYGQYGHPIRVKVSTVGASILSIMLGLTEAQEGVLEIVFRIAKDENLPLIDLKDLKTALQYVGDNRQQYTTQYGNVTTQSVGVIQRSLLALENQGADKFFGEPELDIHDFISVDNNGKGIINILHAVELFRSPDLYASFMLWLLSDLFNTLPEVGDMDKPKIAFFFDEAHLVFSDMPAYRLKQIVQVVKLIRSRGIGLYFISQNPTDIPSEILGQLGNKIQHNLRAFTPAEQKVVKAAADGFRTNPSFNTEEAILNLGTGEALISFQTEKGEPSVVEKVTILPPQSRMGVIDDLSRNKVINSSLLAGKYDEALDNESAHEIINKKVEEQRAEEARIQEEKEQAKREAEEQKQREKEEKEQAKKEAAEQKQKEKEAKEAEKKKKNSLEYKIGKKVANKAIDKTINKGLNSLFKNFFK